MTEAEEQGGKKSCRGWWVRKMELMAVGHLAQGVFPYCPSRQLVPSEKKENQLPMATASDCGQWLVWCGSAWAPLKMLPDARTIRAGQLFGAKSLPSYLVPLIEFAIQLHIRLIAVFLRSRRCEKNMLNPRNSHAQAHDDAQDWLLACKHAQCI